MVRKRLIYLTAQALQRNRKDNNWQLTFRDHLRELEEQSEIFNDSIIDLEEMLLFHAVN